MKRKTRCVNVNNHNCSPCPICDKSEHHVDSILTGYCEDCDRYVDSHTSVFNDPDDFSSSDIPQRGGRRIIKKREFDDD